MNTINESVIACDIDNISPRKFETSTGLFSLCTSNVSECSVLRSLLRRRRQFTTWLYCVRIDDALLSAQHHISIRNENQMRKTCTWMHSFGNLKYRSAKLGSDTEFFRLLRSIILRILWNLSFVNAVPMNSISHRRHTRARRPLQLCYWLIDCVLCLFTIISGRRREVAQLNMVLIVNILPVTGSNVNSIGLWSRPATHTMHLRQTSKSYYSQWILSNQSQCWSWTK